MRAKPGSLVGVRDLQIARERVLARYALAKESDYFQFLGIDRQAEPAEVRRVQQLLLKEISPEMLGPELMHELKRPVEVIREVLDEAALILCTPLLRSAYEQNLLPTTSPPTEQAESGSGLSHEG